MSGDTSFEINANGDKVTQSFCALCGQPFVYPVAVKWLSKERAYAHSACIRKEAGLWETIKWIFKGCPRW